MSNPGTGPFCGSAQLFPGSIKCSDGYVFRPHQARVPLLEFVLTEGIDFGLDQYFKQKTQRKVWLLTFLSFSIFLSNTALALTHTVINLNDNGADSLRYWIANSAANDTIDFAPGLSGTIALTTGTLAINKNLTITGPGAGLLQVSGINSNTVFSISGATVTLSGLAIVNGNASDASVAIGNQHRGGGIYNSGILTINGCVISGNTSFVGSASFSVGGGIANYGTLTVNNSTLSDNTAENLGGAIVNGASLTMNNCTLSDNKAIESAGGGAGEGGGILNSSAATLNNCTFYGNAAGTVGDSNPGVGGAVENVSGSVTVNNCTFSGNFASDFGGGIDSYPTLQVHNTIIAGNTAVNSADDIYQDDHTPVISLGHNFIGKANNSSGWVASDLTGSDATPLDPLLGVLADNGGPTFTMALQSGSSAIDAGDDSVLNFLTTDQRGLPRKSGAHVDIGAFEKQFSFPASQPLVLTNVRRFNNEFQFAFTNAPNVDFTALTATDPAQPLTNWKALGNVPEISSGQYQFTDTSATNWAQFYRVVSP